MLDKTLKSVMILCYDITDDISFKIILTYSLEMCKFSMQPKVTNYMYANMTVRITSPIRFHHRIGHKIVCKFRQTNG